MEFKKADRKKKKKPLERALDQTEAKKYAAYLEAGVQNILKLAFRERSFG